MIFQIQTIIHKIEVGGGMRYLKYAFLPFLMLTLIIAYDFRGAKNWSSPEAMDAAQLARNLAEHKGYTTLIIRPLSIYLLQQKYADDHGAPAVGDLADRAQIKGPHPDLANPPVYPLTLAALMKISSAFKYSQTTAIKPLAIHKWKIDAWRSAGHFWTYPPDFWIGIFNQVLFVALTVMIFFIARRRFDRAVAWTSALIFFGTELFWRFSVSGLSTMLMMVIFLGLAWLLTMLEEKTRVAQLSQNRQLLLAAAAGLIVGLGFLTRYSFGWLIIPVAAFLALFLGANRLLLCVVAVIMFAAVGSPWIIRNHRVSHTFFGTAGYAIYENTPEFPENQLQRSLHPELPRLHPWTKFRDQAQTLLQDEMPKLGGGWIGAFFLVGLLIAYQNPTLSRLRYFLLLCLPVLFVAQALGRTQLSEDHPAINTENLLALAAPLVIIFGTGLFFTLLDQIQFPVPQLRYPVIGGFFGLMCLPMIVVFLSALNPFAARGFAPAYPPYHPPLIQQIAGWMKPGELLMSDIPWATAWYGRQQSLWLTLNKGSDFFEVNDYEKPISALYLTPVTTDQRFLSQWMHGVDDNWGMFIYQHDVPASFPLRHAPNGFLPDQLFLADSDRWSGTEGISASPPAAGPKPAVDSVTK